MVAFTSFNALLKSLQSALQAPLPGLQQQLAMAPPYREVPSEAWVRAQNPRMAGVMLLICRGTAGWQLVFTKRRAYAGVHSAQVSFPGGKLEKEDGNLLSAALRETEEEIGVPSSKIEVVGPMTPLYIPPSNFLVHPFVAVAIQEAPWRVQEAEVAALLEIPMAYLLRAESRESRHLHLGEQTREVPGFVWHEHFIWGATAMMLSEFLGVVRSCFKGNESPLA